MRKLVVVSVHPIHYNDHLFHEISRSGIDISVNYAHKVLGNYPWKEKTAYSFPHRNCSYWMGVDFSLIRKAIFSRNTTFMIAGWDTFFKNILLLTLIIFRKRYTIWTDTVKPNANRGSLKSFVRRIWLQFIWTNAYKILTTGEVGVRAMNKIYPAGASKIINFPFATDLHYFNSTPDFVNSKSETILLSSGRLLNSHKGHDLAIRAMGIVREKGYRFKYFLAGAGPDEQMLKDLVRQLSLDEYVTFLGWQELPQVRQLYSKAQVLVHPAHFDPFPNAVLEAMASSLIVIASDISGSAVERIENGVNGFLVRDNNVDELSDKIIQVINSTAHDLEVISKAARATAEKWDVSYNLKIITNTLE